MASSGSIYFYDPSLPASILFTILYAFPAAFLFYTTIIGPRTGKYGHAGYFVPLCIGAAMEVAAYADRCASVKQPGSIPLYAVSSSLVVIAPVFICASLYMLMGRLIRAGIPEAKGQQQVFGIAPRWLPRIFVASDIISFLTQVSGSAIASAGDWEGSEKGAGTNVLIGGLALQLATFSMFLAIVVRFHRRVHALRHQVDDNLKKVLLGLYVAGFFIWVCVTAKKVNSSSRSTNGTCISRFVAFTDSLSLPWASTDTRSGTSGAYMCSRPVRYSSRSAHWGIIIQGNGFRDQS
ncbi:hypothetical protein CPC735_028550 [Coccidioides posadasii C735 delta SOWgp]|uniref:RTA1 domain-containing protein n=1 Tax=Coccidioides posadasii (strain C735) TaxID=222929 RepID=C5P7W9_COCP7|nr:hypothetical protein CPC735_028550 [Coccidioides posadasii C735 delta SOWgp]EER27519.1 hypothetical protein CPC735_028550 [Coccidioides posadasii C735 delta SOWgp]|eukprot:XP_003069664.1 hypothetical protein CPC735_028550 [Coccidioides posadasii C735 delta SOWgp]